MREAHKRRWLPLTAAITLLAGPAPAADTDERAQTETRLAGVVEEIARLQRDLEQNRERLRAEQEALRTVELELQASAREARTLEAALVEREAELARLQAQRDAQLERIAGRRAELEQQLVAAWRLGRESRLKLLMNQDSPARLGRLLGYYDYFSAALTERIGELRSVLGELDALALTLREERDALETERARHAQALAGLEAERQEKARLLGALDAGLATDAARLAELERNRRDLEQILQRLENALADIPADLGGRSHPRSLKGRLPMPVRGPVAAAFGQERRAGLRWQGWLIGAAPGTPIEAVAYGRVAYADWLRGYGLLLIIDHGDGFMSLYGNNEALLADVGDWVQPGQEIATVGSNAGQPSGLYFELRNRGDAVDPAAWVRRR